VIDPSSPLIRAAENGPFDQKVLRNVDLDDPIERLSQLAQEGVEGVRLGRRSRKSVQNETLLRIGVLDALLDETDDDRVRDELAGVHVALRLAPELGARFPGCAQHVAGRDLRDAEPFA
jgi:hypothetical protein